jgi:deazaflavin-dependent oxidoreductase (nitroreductase family)
MSTTSKRPFARRLQTRLMRIVNVPMRVILGLPVSTPLGKRLMLAFIVGRKSGKTYRQPLSYVRDGDTLLTPGGGRWKFNLVENPKVRLRVRGRDMFARAELVDDLEEVSRLLSLILVSNPSADSFVRVKKDPDGRPNAEDLRNAMRYGFCIVRWHLNQI